MIFIYSINDTDYDSYIRNICLDHVSSFEMVRCDDEILADVYMDSGEIFALRGNTALQFNDAMVEKYNIVAGDSQPDDD